MAASPAILNHSSAIELQCCFSLSVLHCLACLLQLSAWSRNSWALSGLDTVVMVAVGACYSLTLW